MLALFLSLLLSTQSSVQAAPTSTQPVGGDWRLANGHFYSQTSPAGAGFAVVDDDEAKFWSEFQRLGALQTVGYPISRRFSYEGFVTQAFQKLILQWRPEAGHAWAINVFDELNKAGLDGQLFSYRQTPYHWSQSDGSQNLEAAAAIRQSWLDANPAIRARYFSVADPVTTFGLPTSQVEDMGNHYAIRTQRAVFQQWKEAVPWAAAGEVTLANGGDIAKEFAWFVGDYLTPEDPANYPVYSPPAPPGNPTINEAKWIDVDISEQRIRAYAGNQVVYTALVSTGREPNPTVIGQYRIWIKLRYDDMEGGSKEKGDYYYLEDVPYVMYFYQGYGIHGTYWHNNFGTPMSHGCVNLTIADAAWFYNWAEVGTLVNTHY